MERIGAVVIGRNEGERLRQCLVSLAGSGIPVVYVDSGSTDGSPQLARDLDAAVEQLDMSQPFTAARARNAGFERLEDIVPDLEFVQFVDGDCQVSEGWVAKAVDEMHAHTDAAVICGRRRERDPPRSVYNLLCDLEWNTPIGEAEECGGDALLRVSAFREVGGYNPSVIAGEEPEMCLRLRSRGWKVLRIDAEMTLHDAAMTRFGQWWRRTVRAGHAFAELAARGARSALKQRRSMLFWGCGVPLVWAVMLVGAGLLNQSLIWPNLLWGGYLVLAWKIYRYRRRFNDTPRAAASYAFFTVLGKFAQLKGLLLYYINRWRGRKTAIIEYKTAASPCPRETELAQPCA